MKIIKLLKNNFKKMDLSLFTLSFIYCILGAIMIYSASSISTVLMYKLPSNYYFFRQCMWLLLGTICFIGIVNFKKLSRHLRMILSILFVILIIMILVYVGLYGKVNNGMQGWYNLAGYSIQPSEFAKTALIIFMANYYDRLITTKNDNMFMYLIPLAAALIIIALVFMQPDLGSAVIIAGIVLGTFILIPTLRSIKVKSLKILGGLGLILVIGAFVVWPKIANTYQLNRLNFKEPCTRYQESTGYQVCNGFIAIKNGGLFGVGFGNSTQKYLYLPEAHTDMIFPIISEELGCIIGALIIVGYIIILWRILAIAWRSKSPKNIIIAYGTFFYFALHIIVNILGVLSLMPLTGVPLPFLSYGGSFTINAIILLAFCQRAEIENHDDKIRQKLINTNR